MNSHTAANLPQRPKGDIRNLWPMLMYLKPYRLQIFGAAVALIFTSSAVLGMGAGLRYLIDEGIAKGNAHLLDRGFGILLLVVALLALASYARFFLVSWIGERMVADIRQDMYRRIMAMHIGFFEVTKTGELLSRLTADTTLLQTVIGSSISVAARNLLLFIGGLALLLLTSIELTQYVFLMLPLVIVPIIMLGRRVRSLAREAQARVADISSHAEESLSAVRTIQALALEPYDQSRFADRVTSALTAAQTRIRVRAFLTALVIALIFGAIAVVLWIGGKGVLTGRISAGDLSAFIFYSVVVAGAVGAISEVIGDLQRAAGAAERLNELLLLTPEITSAAPASSALSGQGRVQFDHVFFTYPMRPDKQAVYDFSLDVSAGETIALVGPSGAGKTTIFNLLLRFYDPQSGSICLDGVNLRDLPLTQLRHSLGIVPQDPVIFSTTVRDNIRLGNIEANEEEVRSAADLASATEFIARLPQGFNTYVGEKGVQLSGGQKQRLAIARAIIRNPRILLLDEATSALDSENEQHVQQALERVMRGRTTFVIAHRFSTIIRAHRIVLMEEGHIRAVGTHQELLKSSELYARLAELQFRPL